MSDTDATLDPVIEALVELMRSGVRPEVLEAQRILLERLATAGDVFPSRIPAARNVTEVGGYLNLLESAGQPGMRTQAVASALGIAGPGAAVPASLAVGFAELANHRPDVAARPTIPTTLTVRADFHGPLAAALDQIAARGAALPLRAPRPELPPTPVGSVTAVPEDVVLRALGRTLDVMPGVALVDPTADAVAVARLETPATSPLQLVVRELDGGTTVPEAGWVAKKCSDTACVDLPAAPARLLPVASILEDAGWYHPGPPTPPASLRDPGTLLRFRNVTGLVAGETTLGDELVALYTPAQIARSAFAPLVTSVWDGQGFAPPT